MKHCCFALALSWLAAACSPSPPPPAASMTTVDLMVFTQQNQQALAANSVSPHYQRVLQRSAALQSASQIQSLPSQAKLAVKLPKGSVAAVSDDIAMIVNQAMRKPNRNTILAGLASAGLIAGVYLLSEEAEAEQPSTEAQAVPLQFVTLSDEQLDRLLKKHSVALPIAEKSIERQPKEQTSAIQSLKLLPMRPSLGTAAIRQQQQQHGAHGLIVEVQASLPKGQAFQVRARFFDQHGKPLKDLDGRYVALDGQVATASSLSASLLPRHYTASNPLELFLPYLQLHRLSLKNGYRCLVELLDDNGEVLSSSTFIEFEY